MATKEKAETVLVAVRAKSAKQVKIAQRAGMRQVALTAIHENTILALRTAGFLCQYREYMPMGEYDNQCCTTFLAKLHVILTNLEKRKQMVDIRILELLPNQSMQRLFEGMKVRRMSQFLATPLVRMVRLAKKSKMELPKYIQYLHPDFEPPAVKKAKARK